jgi:hypothetical protein
LNEFAAAYETSTRNLRKRVRHHMTWSVQYVSAVFETSTRNL